MTSNFMNVKLIGEANDSPCTPTRTNTVIKTRYNGYKLAESANFDDWVSAIVFPDNDKAQFFLDNFKPSMLDYRQGMVNDDYHFHIIHFKYPRVDELYADQLSVVKGESYDD